MPSASLMASSFIWLRSLEKLPAILAASFRPLNCSSTLAIRLFKLVLLSCEAVNPFWMASWWAVALSSDSSLSSN